MKVSEEVLIACGQILVKHKYCGATDISYRHGQWGVFIPAPEIDNIWEEIFPFENTLESREQFDVIFGNWLVTTIHDCEVDGWWVECYRTGFKGEKMNHTIVSYPVLYDAKYKRECEMKFVIDCIEEELDILAAENRAADEA